MNGSVTSVKSVYIQLRGQILNKTVLVTGPSLICPMTKHKVREKRKDKGKPNLSSGPECRHFMFDLA